MTALMERARERTVDGLRAGSYLDVIKRIAEIVPDLDGRGPSAGDYYGYRWEITGLLFAIDRLIPNVREHDPAYWKKVFTSGHFVPEEIIGHHLKQSLGDVQRLSERIAAQASAYLTMLEAADSL